MQPRTSKPISEGRRNRAAFTLVELLVIVAVLALLAMCLLPALARTQPDTRSFQCLNNHRQLARAWRMYADDSNDRLCGMILGTSITINDARSPWVQGWLTWDIRLDNTNAVLLTDPRYASIANYGAKDARIFKCPADQFVSAPQRNRGWRQRVRSVSGNLFVGGNKADIEAGPTDPTLQLVTKWAELANPKPAETWLFVDEHPDSINDATLYAPRENQWVDMPANYHDGGAGIAYADGSAEVHRWGGSLLDYPVRLVFTPLPTQPNDPDITWLRSRTPRKPGVN